MPQTYAFVSHESAIEALWSAAARHWENLLDDEGVWLIPAPDSCVRNQRGVKELARSVELPSLGIRTTPIDLLVPDKSCYSRGRLARFHVWKDFFPPRSFIRVHERIFVSTPYFAVMQLAAAQRVGRISRERAAAEAAEIVRLQEELNLESRPLGERELVAWENVARLVRAAQVLTDFQGTYRYVPAKDAGQSSMPDYDVAYGMRPLVAAGSFGDYLRGMAAGRGITRAREVAGLAFVGSASPMETMLSLMLTLPVEMGGFGLPRPELNLDVSAEEPQRGLVSQQAMFADLCWPDQRLVMEYYGWWEHAGAGPRKVAEDCARVNSLEALGWRVMHVTYEQIRTVEGMSLVARQAARLLGVELREADELERIWRTRLLALLLPKVAREAW